MKQKIATAALLSGALLLTGCVASKRIPDYSCPLTGSEAGTCASMQDAYKAAKKVKPGNTSKVQSVFEGGASSGSGVHGSTEMPVVGAQLSPLGTPTKATPVYIQPKVMYVWLAPYKDGSNNLRSGENVYFATEGRWNYGSLNEAGVASGVTFQPTRPRTPESPVVSAAAKPVSQRTTAPNADQVRPAAPPEATAAASAVFQASAPNAPAGPVTLQPSSTDGITQPYDRLGGK